MLGLFINNTLSWKIHIECIKSKLSSACYAMQSVKQNVSLNTLKMIYYVMTYGLLFWGQSSDSMKIFILQKNIIRIAIGCRSSYSCRKLFFNLEILPLPSQYILSLLLFMMRNRNQILSVLRFITLTLGNMLIFTYLLWIWLNARRGCTV